MMSENDLRRWYPVTRSEELIARHVAHTQLLGQELALWRDDAGRVNAWENRCPHRGVRLSIGINDGTELRCRYHGWRYASGTAQCTFIPAHPSQKPASTIKARSFPVAEIYGYVWVALADQASAGDDDMAKLSAMSSADSATLAGATATADTLSATPSDARLNGRQITTLRSLFVDAPESTVAAELQALDSDEAPRVHWLQPVDAARTVIHAAVLDVPPRTSRLALLRHHHAALARVRDLAETRHRSAR